MRNIHGGTTHPGQPGAIFGCVDDHDRGDKTRTSTRGDWINSCVHTYRPQHTVPRRWHLKNNHGGRESNFSTSPTTKSLENRPNEQKHEYSLKSLIASAPSLLRARRYEASSGDSFLAWAAKRN